MDYEPVGLGANLEAGSSGSYFEICSVSGGASEGVRIGDFFFDALGILPRLSCV